jgi:electron transfer flavoprotein beta subunit
MTAELLGIPVTSAVTQFEVQDGKVVAQREIEGGTEVVELRMPCALTLTKGAYEPRYASLKGIMAAKKKPLEEKPAASGDTAVARSSSPTRRSARPAASWARAPMPCPS